MSNLTIKDIVEKQLCTGCGACSYVEPERFIMGNSFENGRRPFIKINPKPESGDGVKTCPGIALEHSIETVNSPYIVKELFDAWGPVLGVWEGYAADDEIRFAGSSGGAATALSLYCIDQMEMSGVLQTSMDDDKPYLNKTVYSKSKSDLLACSGSRYSPSSPCESLDIVDKQETKSVFIGKPCDVAALQKARKLKPELDRNIGVAISFFCAGVPAFNGLFDLLYKVGIKSPKEQLKSLRFRGNGWPGRWSAEFTDENNNLDKIQLSYAESWGFLQKYRQWRCYICPDHSGEFADISVGDPWYRKVVEGEAGKSLILARTQHGLNIIKAAAAAGYIILEKEDISILPKSQPNLLEARGALWGRLLALKLLGCTTPQFKNFNFFKFWLELPSYKMKYQSIVGTFKRIYIKKLNKRISLSEWDG